MSRARTGIMTALEKRARANDQLADYLIKDPHCLDGNPQKDKAYRVALEYFDEKQRESKATGEVFYNGRVTLDLEALINCYEEADGDTKQEYAKKIAQYVLQTQENWLKRIPDEIKNDAFWIINQYLEQQRGS